MAGEILERHERSSLLRAREIGDPRVGIREDELGVELGERHGHKGPGIDVRLRNGQVGVFDNARSVQNQVEINNTRGVLVGRPLSTEGVLDLSEHIIDANDGPEDLLLLCDDESFTVDELVLRTHFDQWVPDRVISLTLSDGEVDSTLDLTVRVVNVNDAPVKPRSLLRAVRATGRARR